MTGLPGATTGPPGATAGAPGATAAEVVVVGAGALGSATAWQLARRGVDVVLLEQFAFGHDRGASHDTSRILRRSYHTAGYVRLAGEAYGDWALLEREAGEQLSDTEIAARWPALSLPAGTVGVHQADTSIVPAGRGTATMQRLARSHGARLVDESPVTALVDRGDAGVEVRVGAASYLSRRVVLAADAWTNHLLAQLGTSLPLTVTREQVTYFAPAAPDLFGADRLPVWIWMDSPSFYGFPTYDEGGNGSLVKAAEDCGGAVTTAEGRSFETDPAALDRLVGFVSRLLPGVGAPARTVTCLYTLTPDRDFVIGAVSGHESVLVGLGAGHGFKFAPTFGRVLADLATVGRTASDISAFTMDRPALVDADHPVSWLV